MLSLEKKLGHFESQPSKRQMLEGGSLALAKEPTSHKREPQQAEDPVASVTDLALKVTAEAESPCVKGAGGKM